MVMQELPASPPMNMESDHLPADENPPTPVPPSISLAEIPPVNDSSLNAESSSPCELPSQPPSDHREPTSRHEPFSSPSVTQSVLQATPQDAHFVEPPTEVSQEPERQPTPPSPVHDASSAPQKVKTSFKDFLMRKKKEQVESPVISSSTIPTPLPAPTVPPIIACGSDPVSNPSEEAKEAAKEVIEYQSPVTPIQPLGPLTTEPPDVHMDTSSPFPELEPAEAKPEIFQISQLELDRPSESWLLDPQILKPGVVVDLRQDLAQDWVYGETSSVRGVIEHIVNIPGRPMAVLFKPIDGKSQEIVIPVTTTIPARPSEEGEAVIILSGKHKGMVGIVVRLREGMASVELVDPEAVVIDLEPPWLCLFFREDRGPLLDPIPPPPRVPPEKGESMSPPPAQQSEDGEIIPDPLPRSQSQQPGSRNSPPVTAPLRAAPINAPTQPRSFQNTWKNNASTIPPRSNSLSHLMNANPNGGANNPSNLGNTFANSLNRPSPPSGPKALRGLNPRSPFDPSRFKSGTVSSGLSGGVSGLPVINGNGMGVGLKREPNPNNGHPGIPKGPSADRDRERERTNGNWSTKNWGGGWR